MARIPRNIGSRLDYGLDWSEWLANVVYSAGAEDKLSSVVWTLPDEFVLEATGILNGTIAYFWISDSQLIAKGKYVARCDILTVGGRIEHDLLIFEVS